MMGVEPTTSAWKANVLPLNYICKCGFYLSQTGHLPLCTIDQIVSWIYSADLNHQPVFNLHSGCVFPPSHAHRKFFPLLTAYDYKISESPQPLIGSKPFSARSACFFVSIFHIEIRAIKYLAWF